VGNNIGPTLGNKMTPDRIKTIKKFIELEAIIPLKKKGKDIMINSHGMYKLKEISRMLDDGLSKGEIVRRLER